MAKDSRPPRLIRSWVTCQAPKPKTVSTPSVSARLLVTRAAAFTRPWSPRVYRQYRRKIPGTVAAGPA
jgi:hypothetical protein